jgi:anti-sigma-K factor RskA
MTRTPRFDDLVDEPLAADERERLERVHDLLVAAGPPPELSPQLERGPSLAMTLGGRRRGHHQRRIALLAAALSIAAAVFLAGYLAGNRGGSLAAAKTLQLRGTAAAPDALASLVVQDVDAAGNWPMRLSVTGLPKLPPRGYYAVYLTRHGKPLLPCGVFVVKSAHGAVTVQLNAPYHVRRGDSWVVTKELPGEHGTGQVVLHPVT